MSDDLTARAAALLATLGETERELALAALERLADHTAHGGPLSWLLGIRYNAVGPGTASCSIDIGRSHHNPNGMAHGSVAYALLDSAMGAAFSRALEPPLRCATLELKVNYLKPVVAGRITASAELIERTNRFGVLIGRVVDEDNQAVALGQGTFAIIQPK